MVRDLEYSPVWLYRACIRLREGHRLGNVRLEQDAWTAIDRFIWMCEHSQEPTVNDEAATIQEIMLDHEAPGYLLQRVQIFRYQRQQEKDSERFYAQSGGTSMYPDTGGEIDDIGRGDGAP